MADLERFWALGFWRATGRGGRERDGQKAPVRALRPGRALRGLLVLPLLLLGSPVLADVLVSNLNSYGDDGGHEEYAK